MHHSQITARGGPAGRESVQFGFPFPEPSRPEGIGHEFTVTRGRPTERSAGAI